MLNPNRDQTGRRASHYMGHPPAGIQRKLTLLGGQPGLGSPASVPAGSLRPSQAPHRTVSFRTQATQLGKDEAQDEDARRGDWARAIRAKAAKEAKAAGLS